MLTNCTLCLIKPHAIQHAGNIIERILNEGFEISALSSQFLDRKTAEEFMEIYKGIIPDFQSTVDQLVSGVSIALEVR